MGDNMRNNIGLAKLLLFLFLNGINYAYGAPPSPTFSTAPSVNSSIGFITPVTGSTIQGKAQTDIIPVTFFLPTGNLSTTPTCPSSAVSTAPSVITMSSGTAYDANFTSYHLYAGYTCNMLLTHFMTTSNQTPSQVLSSPPYNIATSVAAASTCPGIFGADPSLKCVQGTIVNVTSSLCMDDSAFVASAQGAYCNTTLTNAVVNFTSSYGYNLQSATIGTSSAPLAIAGGITTTTNYIYKSTNTQQAAYPVPSCSSNNPLLFTFTAPTTLYFYYQAPVIGQTSSTTVYGGYFTPPPSSPPSCPPISTNSYTVYNSLTYYNNPYIAICAVNGAPACTCASSSGLVPVVIQPGVKNKISVNFTNWNFINWNGNGRFWGNTGWLTNYNSGSPICSANIGSIGSYP